MRLDPFKPSIDPDDVLWHAAQNGSARDLEELLARYESWIQKRVRYAVWNAQEADDITQDILVRVLSGIKRFEGRCTFKAWLRKIVNNFITNLIERISSRETVRFCSLDRIRCDGHLDFADSSYEGVETLMHFEETKLLFMKGILLCLDRTQRLVFVLGALFDVTDVRGAALLGISPHHFRRILCKSRRELLHFMTHNCSLLNRACVCRCPHKTRRYVKRGYVNPKTGLFDPSYLLRLGELAAGNVSKLEHFMTSHQKKAKVESRNGDVHGAILQQLLKDPQFCDSLNLAELSGAQKRHRTRRYGNALRT